MEIASIAGATLVVEGSEIAGEAGGADREGGAGVALDIAGKTNLVASCIVVTGRTNAESSAVGGDSCHG
jgi:hypothetical protein